jgi:hypothetical protein
MLTSPYMEMHGHSKLGATRKGILGLSGAYKNSIRMVKAYIKYTKMVGGTPGHIIMVMGYTN